MTELQAILWSLGFAATAGVTVWYIGRMTEGPWRRSVRAAKRRDRERFRDGRRAARELARHGATFLDDSPGRRGA